MIILSKRTADNLWHQPINHRPQIIVPVKSVILISISTAVYSENETASHSINRRIILIKCQ
jgi:hypothetical protein